MLHFASRLSVYIYIKRLASNATNTHSSQVFRITRVFYASRRFELTLSYLLIFRTYEQNLKESRCLKNRWMCFQFPLNGTLFAIPKSYVNSYSKPPNALKDSGI